MSNINIRDRQVKDVIVLDIDGNLRLGESSEALRKAVRRLVAEGQNRILLNLAQVSNIDSSGLGELVASRVTLGKSGGEIKLLHLEKRIRELMTMTKLLTVFEVFEDEQEALDSFKSIGAATTEADPVTTTDAQRANA